MPLVVTIDVEDWPQSTLDHTLPITERARRNMEHVLDILARHNRTVTCFVLGRFAEKFPQCVRRIVAEGHELASHGFGHIEVTRQSPQEFRADVRRARNLLEEIAGVRVKGYRAPDFTAGPVAEWALEILAAEGHEYDASLFPTGLYRNGVAGWPPQPVRVRLRGGRTLTELPAATAVGAGRRWPVAGGGYHRLLPGPAIRRLVGTALARGEVFVMYCHPYEFDPHELSQLNPPVPWRTRLHQGLGRRGFESKFSRLLDIFQPVLAVDAAAALWPDYEMPCAPGAV